MDFGYTPEEAAKVFDFPTYGLGDNAMSDDRQTAREVLAIAAHLIAHDDNFAILFERLLAREVEDV